MPIYEYICKHKHRFVKMLKMEESKIITTCPKCNSVAIRQMSTSYSHVHEGTRRFHK